MLKTYLFYLFHYKIDLLNSILIFCSYYKMSGENINSVPKFIPPEIIGERMKERELKTAQTVWKVEPWQYAVLRFDGHNFSKFTNGFKNHLMTK